MAPPVRRRDTGPQAVRHWGRFREVEGLQDQLAQPMQRIAPDGDGTAPEHERPPRVDLKTA